MAKLFPEFKTKDLAAVVEFNDAKLTQFYLDVSTGEPIIHQELSGIIVLSPRSEYDCAPWAKASISWAHELTVDGCRYHNDSIPWDGSSIELAACDELEKLAQLFNAEWIERDGEFLHVHAVIDYKSQQTIDRQGVLLCAKS